MTIKKQEIYQEAGISGAVLKWIAIITMAIDHFGSGFLNYYNDLAGINVDTLYFTSRLIGRLAFPIFAFLIIQGYQHTSNRKKYVSQLLIFAILSEIPFNLAFYNSFFYWDHQNIFFTLAIGIIGFAAYENYEQKKQPLFQILSFVISALIAYLLNVDYDIYGIVFIFGLGMLRNNKSKQALFGVIMGLAQTFAASLAFFPIWYYNGKRGKQNKWIFYIFYPAHLIIIFLFRYIVI